VHDPVQDSVGYRSIGDQIVPGIDVELQL
jgi:hypothetical protein